MKPTLVWTPTSDYLFSAVEDGDLSIAISPFVKVDALKQLLSRCHNPESLQIITSWSKASLLSKVTDPEIFLLLQDAGAKLFLHPKIHLKLFVLAKNLAFCTSSNITLSGLGLSPNPNVEIGSEVPLNCADWIAIYRLLNESTIVDDQMFKQARAYVARYKETAPEVPELLLTPIGNKAFSLESLPVCDTPEYFLNHVTLLNIEGSKISSSLVHAVVHDQVLYGINPVIGNDEAAVKLRAAFRSHPFITAVVELLQQHESARFGLVADWIQQNCTDKPQPYRKEIKESVRILYDWLAYYYDEISWSVPGRHSMVISWNGQD